MLTVLLLLTCLNLLPLPYSLSAFPPVLISASAACMSASAPFVPCLSVCIFSLFPYLPLRFPLFVCLHLPSCLPVCTTTLMLPKVVTINASVRVACLYNYPDAPQSNYSATLCAACLYNLKIQDPAMITSRLALNASLRAALSVQLNSNAPQRCPHYCDYSAACLYNWPAPPLALF
jgi:hypothetical protein